MIKIKAHKFIKNMKDKISLKAVFTCLSIILIIILEILFFFTNHIRGPEVIHSMTGAYGEKYGVGTEKLNYSQEFTPKYKHIQSISIDADTDLINENGAVHWSITDQDGDCIKEGDLSYEKLQDSRFTEITVDVYLRCFQKYYFNVSFDETDGYFPRMVIDRGQESFEESGILFINEYPLENTSLVWQIRYADTTPIWVQIGILCMPLLILFLWFMEQMAGRDQESTFYISWMTVKSVLAGIVLPVFTIYLCEAMIQGQEYWIGVETWRTNTFLLYLIWIGLFLLCQSFTWTVRLGILLPALFYTVDFYILTFRGTSFKLASLSALRTAGNVASGYTYEPNGALILLLMYILAVWLIKLPEPMKKPCLNKRQVGLIHMGGFICGIIYSTVMWNYLMDVEWVNHMPGTEYVSSMSNDVYGRKSGYLAATVLEIKNNRLALPEGYSEEKVKEILAPYQNTEVQKPLVLGQEELPTIIIVVNESLTDLRVLGDLEIDRDPLAFIHSLEENTISGYANVSTIGGGTANSEFELLTGWSMIFFPDEYYPFSTIINEPMESLISYLADMGYATYAMHPSVRENWNRTAVYPRLGFQTSYWIEDFDETKWRHHGVSDIATYEKIIELYDNKDEDTPLLVYDMTMQNHGGYENIDVENPIEHEFHTVSEFLSIMQYSDRDFEKLVEYFKQQEDKVVICMVGDHQPKLEDAFYDMMQERSGQNDFQRMENQYKTPFVIWTNYDMPEEHGLDISMNYLGGYILKAAGLPLTDKMLYLADLQKQYPIITKNFIRDADGVVYTTKEEWSDKILEYESVQYMAMH